MPTLRSVAVEVDVLVDADVVVDTEEMVEADDDFEDGIVGVST